MRLPYDRAAGGVEPGQVVLLRRLAAADVVSGPSARDRAESATSSPYGLELRVVRADSAVELARTLPLTVAKVDRALSTLRAAGATDDDAAEWLRLIVRGVATLDVAVRAAQLGARPAG